MIFTSESVSEGHPDKVCDLISDAILDECLRLDKESKVACEVFATYKKIIISGEITCKERVDYISVARKTLLSIGYDSDDKSMDGRTFPIENLINVQSPEISDHVIGKNKKNLGAGDQGLMFGYATSKTYNMMPLPITLASEIMKMASDLRKSGKFLFAYPDMKAQVSIEDSKNTIKIINIIMAIQCSKVSNKEDIKQYAIKNIIKPVLKKHDINFSDDIKIIINTFNVGGPLSDTGLTGRKIIVDTYGGWSRHGGGAFSGKDGTKVDRSGAYMARYVAKNIVAASLMDECEIQISYVIGNPEPTSISLNTFNSEKSCYKQEHILKAIKKCFDFRPYYMIKKLKLDTPIFSRTSAYGHFGNDLSLPWEQTDKVEELKSYMKTLDKVNNE